jgi:hypothetical protein
MSSIYTESGRFVTASFPARNADSKSNRQTPKGSECTSTFVTRWTEDLHYNPLEI